MAWPGERGEAGVAVGAPDEAVDHRIGRQGRDPGQPADGEVPGRRQGEPPGQGQFGVGPGRGRGIGAPAVQEDVELVGGEAVPAAARRSVGRRSVSVAGGNPGDVDLGEAHRALALVALADARAGGVDGDGQGPEGRAGKVTTWPGTTRDACDSVTFTCRWPSKVRVTRVT